MVKEGTVTSVQQTKVALQAHSICVHGDGAHAVQFAKHARQEF
ncbi:LamB/YcsF family protein [Solibacillus silvestris]|nr:LamB/YcsF family protein [Solibacillus silvestris]